MDIEQNPDVTNAISHATCMMGIDLHAGAIVIVTRSGFTARMIASYRPGCPVYGCCMNESVWRKMSLNWGIIPLLCEMPEESAQLFEDAVAKVEAHQIVKPGELMLITAGMPLGKTGSTNSIRVHEAGKPFMIRP
jgi:pyruvate kinase